MVCVQGQSVENSQVNIVCYTGGACGDLITALIEVGDTQIAGSAVKINKDRLKLKKPYLFSSDQEKDAYLNLVRSKYKSISSHDFEYHKKNNHKIIVIDVDDWDNALWAARRFKNLHKDVIWKQIMSDCNISSVTDYAKLMIDFSQMATNYATCSIKLSDITNGNLIEKLHTVYKLQLDSSAEQFYKKWLTEVIPTCG